MGMPVLVNQQHALDRAPQPLTLVLCLQSRQPRERRHVLSQCQLHFSDAQRRPRAGHSGAQDRRRARCWG